MKKLIKILDLMFYAVAWVGIMLAVFADEYLQAILLAILLLIYKLDNASKTKITIINEIKGMKKENE